ncbi:perilipin 6 [Nematolebias whitei]|uniref:perilipin 6 n=1 Tax=Nematolebias whitei TaxID=451745 RepID=UPI001896B94F|nr:perilipin 6 [Nematolebias whitei]
MVVEADDLLYTSCGQLGAETSSSGQNQVGLRRILELTGELLQYLHNLVVALLSGAESFRRAALRGIGNRAVALAELTPVQQVRELPAQIQQVLRDLQELSKVLLQLVINTTPLYDMLEQPSPQQLEDFLNQEDLASDSSSRRSSANSLFSKAMDGRPRRRRSLYSRARRGSGGPLSPESPNKRRSSMKDSSSPEVDSQTPPSEDKALRRPSATELLLMPLQQFISQSQKAFEYLSPNAADNAAITLNTDDS